MRFQLPKVQCQWLLFCKLQTRVQLWPGTARTTLFQITKFKDLAKDYANLKIKFIPMPPNNFLVLVRDKCPDCMSLSLSKLDKIFRTQLAK